MPHGPRPESRGWRWAAAVLLAAALPAGCTLMEAAGSVAVEAGRRLLVDRARDNFGEFADSIEMLINALLDHVQPAGQRPDLDRPDGAPRPTPQSLGEHASLEVTVVRETRVADDRWLAVPLLDGEVVRDGVGREGDGDLLKVRIKPSVDGWLYAVWIDATAWATPVFPFCDGETWVNPVRAGQQVDVPAGDRWFELDGQRGTEALYVLLAPGPRPDLEGALRSLAGRERPATSADGGVLETHAAGSQADFSRGLGKVRPGHSTGVTTPDGVRHEVPTLLFPAAEGAQDMLVTRWFRHE